MLKLLTNELILSLLNLFYILMLKLLTNELILEVLDLAKLF